MCWNKYNIYSGQKGKQENESTGNRQTRESREVIDLIYIDTNNFTCKKILKMKIISLPVDRDPDILFLIFFKTVLVLDLVYYVNLWYLL